MCSGTRITFWLNFYIVFANTIQGHFNIFYNCYYDDNKGTSVSVNNFKTTHNLPLWRMSYFLGGYVTSFMNKININASKKNNSCNGFWYIRSCLLTYKKLEAARRTKKNYFILMTDEWPGGKLNAGLLLKCPLVALVYVLLASNRFSGTQCKIAKAFYAKLCILST